MPKLLRGPPGAKIQVIPLPTSFLFILCCSCEDEEAKVTSWLSKGQVLQKADPIKSSALESDRTERHMHTQTYGAGVVAIMVLKMGSLGW